MYAKVFIRCLHSRICSAVTAPSFCSTLQFSRRITQPGCRVGWVTKLLLGFIVVYISTSITKALAPHCLQNSGSGTAISSC